MPGAEKQSEQMRPPDLPQRGEPQPKTFYRRGRRGSKGSKSKFMCIWSGTISVP